MGKDLDIDYFKAALKEAQEKCVEKAPEIKSAHRKAFAEACEIFHDGFEAQKKAETEEEMTECAKAQQKAMKKCVKAASKVFEKIDMTKSVSLQGAILAGAIIMQATPDGLAKFCEEDQKNAKLIEYLLKEKDLMKEMLTNGGAKDGNYGRAMQVYTEILATFPDPPEDEFASVNKKIALAAALELCSPIKEFDTKTQVDPIERYQHYSRAYAKGELDPAFPHFSVWELRHVVNCDATNEQLQWGRDMMMNYAPYITSITDLKKKYVYILDTDVLMRNPSWTSSPRTYQQVLSGGGKETPNAWFGRFILKTFGIPSWGCKTAAGKEAFTRWTSEGWAALNKADWDTCEWEGVSGIDFKGEIDARSAHTPEDYCKKLVLLECLAEVLDGRRGLIKEEEKMILHPLRTWRSLAIIQKALMLEPASVDTFERTGEGVKTNVEKYLEIYEKDEADDKIKVKKGSVTFPSGSNVSTYGSIMVIASFQGGKQINFVGDGNVDFDVPDDVESKTYTVTLEVCTVHSKQSPLLVSVDHGAKVPIQVPYTVGEWKTTKGVEIEVTSGGTLSFTRERPSFGMAIKKVMLSPC